MSSEDLLTDILNSLTRAARQLDDNLAIMDAKLELLSNRQVKLAAELDDLRKRLGDQPERDEWEDITIIEEDELPSVDGILGEQPVGQRVIALHANNSDPVVAMPNPDELMQALGELWPEAK